MVKWVIGLEALATYVPRTVTVEATTWLQAIQRAERENPGHVAMRVHGTIKE